MSAITEPVTRATSADCGTTTDDVKIKMTGKVNIRQKKKKKNLSYSKERQCSVSISDIPSYTIGVDITVISPNSNDRKHRHYYETIIFVLEGKGYSIIEGDKVEWEAGDALHIPPWAWHQHFNTDLEREVKHLSGTNEPLLQSVGEIAIREESE